MIWHVKVWICFSFFRSSYPIQFAVFKNSWESFLYLPRFYEFFSLLFCRSSCLPCILSQAQMSMGIMKIVWMLCIRWDRVQSCWLCAFSTWLLLLFTTSLVLLWLALLQVESSIFTMILQYFLGIHGIISYTSEHLDFQIKLLVFNQINSLFSCNTEMYKRYTTIREIKTSLVWTLHLMNSCPALCSIYLWKVVYIVNGNGTSSFTSYDPCDCDWHLPFFQPFTGLW